MAYRTILLSLNEVGRNAELVPAVARFASRLGAHVVGLYVVPGIAVYPTSAYAAAPDIIDVNRRYYVDAKAGVEKLFNDTMRKEGVAHEFVVIDSALPSVSDVVLANSHHVDLVIISATDGTESHGVEAGFVEGIAVASGRPVMVVPRRGKLEFDFSQVLLAWNDSRESSRAAFDALSLLKQAKQVNITRVDAGLRGEVSGADIAETLSRHDVKCNVVSVASDGLEVGETLLRAAREQGAGLIVMGAYGQSRLMEFIFGGATKHMINKLDRPVLLSH